MNKDDLVRLRHMLDAAADALHISQGATRSSLDSDRVLTLALTMCLTIVGEAASRISPETQNSLAEIPWPQITGMRNRLIHAYYDVNLDVVWQTLTDDLPPLIQQLQVVLNREEQDDAKPDNQANSA